MPSEHIPHRLGRDPDEVAYPSAFVARLMTSGPTPYVMLADTLAGLQAQLHTGLTRADR